MVQEWGALTLYAFPPFILIGRVLLKMKQDQVLEACLITPLWRAQPWFPLVLEMSIDFPVLIPMKEDTCGTAGVIKGIMIPFQHL